MKIHPSRFEQVTALTDVALGFLAGYAAFQVFQFSGFKSAVWGWAFALLAFSAFVAALAHGFEMTQKTNERLWMPINLSLGGEIRFQQRVVDLDIADGQVQSVTLASG